MADESARCMPTCFPPPAGIDGTDSGPPYHTLGITNAARTLVANVKYGAGLYWLPSEI